MAPSMPHTSAYEDAQALRRQMEEQLSRWVAAHDTDTVVRVDPECIRRKLTCAQPQRDGGQKPRPAGNRELDLSNFDYSRQPGGYAVAGRDRTPSVRAAPTMRFVCAHVDSEAFSTTLMP